ncbi:MAG: (Fe-S)-binding protein [Elusimicrobiota bacterium]
MLKRLITDLGERPLYDAVSQCSRCGYCEQACPTYTATGSEPLSARGRNQLVRMLVEGKLRDPASAEEALSTCLLCGGCTTACPARVPTADIVLEGRRMLRGEGGRLVRLLTDLLTRRPERFAALLRWGYRLKNWGLSRLVVKTRLLRLVGLRGLEIADGHLDRVPERFLFEYLREDSALARAEGAAWAYFAPCGPNYVLPDVGRATVEILKAARGRGVYLRHKCCGLMAYNYGSLEQARELARENIRLLEESGCPEEAPVVGDCSSCVSFMKSYPQLFMEEPEWKERARRFSSRIRDVTELFADAKPAPGEDDETTYHDSCRARNGQGIVDAPRRTLRAGAGAAYRELPKAEVCCGGAGAFAFTHSRLSEELLRKKTANIASIHARIVVTSSTSCLIQLARGLQKYYPECKVVHFSQWLRDKTSESKKTSG